MDVWGSFELDLSGSRTLGGSASDRDLSAGSLARTWADISTRVGRNDLPALLVNTVAMGLLSDPVELRIGLENTWTTCEWPGLAADRDLWVTLFDMAREPGTFLDETEVRPTTELPETLCAYRAAAPGHEEGLSWTASFERAHWFATRLGGAAGGEHRIFEMDVPREWVLASFRRTRGESEYIVDTTQNAGDAMREVLPEQWQSLLAAPLDDEQAGPALD